MAIINEFMALYGNENVNNNFLRHSKLDMNKNKNKKQENKKKNTETISTV